MLAKIIRILTMWTSSDNRRNCLKKIAVKIQVTQFVMLLCSSFLLLPFLHATAEGEELYFTGTYPEEGYTFVDVPFTLGSHSVVDITYNAACRNVLNSSLYLRRGDLTNIPYNQSNFDWYNIAISHDEDPLEGYPLNKGNYIVRIVCKYGVDTDDPNWAFLVETNPINLTFAPEDSEPASMVPTAPTQSTSFSGWLGLWGLLGDPRNELGVNRLGHDIADYKFYSLKKGTRIKFRAAWDSYTASTDARSPDMRVKIELYSNGQTYFVTDLDLLKNSGDETREITLLEDGVYRITAVALSYIGTNTDPKEYRAYTIDVILNGEALPDVKIGGVHQISTKYWDDDSGQYVTVKDLVPGESSEVDIRIANYGSKSVPVTLKYGLSVKKGPIKTIGVVKLNIAPGDGSFAIYETTLLTPADTPFALEGDLVVVLYDSANGILDTFQTKVGITSTRHQIALICALKLLLRKK